VVEVLAAAVGAAIGIAASGVGGFMRKDNEAAMSVVRLTAAVEHIAAEVSQLRVEIKEDRQELYPRINGLEQRVAALEAKS
jgi:outer membrane murein-binding lipoprotein Lpp